MMRTSYAQLSEWAVLTILAISILFRGGKGLEMTWLLSLLACALVLGFASKKLLFIERSQSTKNEFVDPPWFLSALTLLFSFWMILSFVFSSTQNYGLDEVMRSVSFSIFFLWTIRRVRSERNTGVFMDHFSEILSAAIIVATLIGVLVYILQPVNRFVGTFFDYRFTTDYWPNAWAECVLLAWPLLLMTIISSKQKLRSWWILGLGIVLGSLILSYSRGAGIAFTLQLCALALLSCKSAVKVVSSIKKRALLETLGTILIVIIVFFGVNEIRSRFHDVQSVQQKITFTAAEGSSSINERRSFWNQALKLSADHPILGYGPYSFRFIQPRLADSVLATSDHPHNFFLKAAMETGWPSALLLVVLIVFSVFPATWKAIRISDSSQRKTVFLLVSVIGVLAHNMIDYNLQFVGIALPFWIIIGALAAVSFPFVVEHKKSFGAWSRCRALLKLEMIFAIALLLVVLVEGTALSFSSFGRHAEANGDFPSALSWYHRARYQIFSRDMHLSETQIYLNQKKPDQAMVALDEYFSQNKEDVRGWRLLGFIARQKNDQQLEIDALNHAYALGKKTDLGILKQLLDTKREPAQAKVLSARKLEFDTLFSAFADAIQKNTHFIALSQNPEYLVDVSKQLSELFPTDSKRYAAIADSAHKHALEERANQTARSAGILW